MYDDNYIKCFAYVYKYIQEHAFTNFRISNLEKTAIIQKIPHYQIQECVI